MAQLYPRICRRDNGNGAGPDTRALLPGTGGAPERLFRADLRPHPVRQYDVSPDGQRFLLNRPVELPDLPIRLLIGWRQELVRKAGPGW